MVGGGSWVVCGERDNGGDGSWVVCGGRGDNR